MTMNNRSIGLRRWDVLAVNIKTGEHRVLEADKDHRSAEACMNIAIMRRGLETEFYKLLPHREGQVEE